VKAAVLALALIKQSDLILIRPCNNAGDDNIYFHVDRLQQHTL